MLARAVIVTRTPWPLPAVFSKLDGLTRFLAPLLPAPLIAASAQRGQDLVDLAVDLLGLGVGLEGF